MHSNIDLLFTVHSCISAQASIEPLALFRNFECLSRESVLVLGVQHGENLVGGCEDMHDMYFDGPSE